jgi:predicted Zn finger-like uncharacterized protein
MIVSCPQCSSRYRIRDDKIQGAGARIKCPSCDHRFVVYRESEKFVVGGTQAQPKGVPVTFARGGELKRAEVAEEEDEDAEAPTTLMPHGSAVADQFRQSIQADRDRLFNEDARPSQKRQAPSKSSSAGHRPQAPPDELEEVAVQAAPRPPPAPPPAPAPTSPANRVGAVVGLAAAGCALVGVAYVMGLLG